LGLAGMETVVPECTQGLASALLFFYLTCISGQISLHQGLIFRVMLWILEGSRNILRISMKIYLRSSASMEKLKA